MNNTTLMDVILLFVFSILALSPTFIKAPSQKQREKTPQFQQDAAASRFALQRHQLTLRVLPDSRLLLKNRALRWVQAKAALSRLLKKGVFDEVILEVAPNTKGGDVVAAVNCVVEAGCRNIGFRQVGGGTGDADGK